MHKWRSPPFYGEGGERPVFSEKGGAKMRDQLKHFVMALVLGAGLMLVSASASAEEVAPASAAEPCETAGADGCWTEIGRLLGAADFAGVREMAGTFRRLYPVDQRAQMAAALARLTEPELSDNKEAKITRQPGRVEMVTTASLYGAGLGGQLANAINADGSIVPLIVVGGLGAGEHMWVAPHQFAADAAADLGQVEASGLAGDLGVQHHLQQQVAQVLGQVGVVAMANGIGHLVGLLQHVGHQGGVGLLQVPGAAAIGIPQAGHHGLQLCQGRQGGIGNGAHGGRASRTGWRSPSHFVAAAAATPQQARGFGHGVAVLK